MQKILVANRGEIALRVMRSAREMGLQTVAIYSDADRNAPHVLFADESVNIGPPPSSESYLVIDKIIQVAKELGVDGIHPGYGFLSENAEFSKAVSDAGITFIGPSAHSIDLMGNKLAAKKAVKEYDIPLVPGTDGAVDDMEEAKTVAREIGFPILVKAAAGGGGKGMRIVENEGELEDQISRAMSEAKNAFGNPAVFIEKFVGSPRHIEIQILADNHGNLVHLFERECSIQRRHQKVIEEAPSSVLTPEIREKMGQCALDVARSCNYSGAGTVEFLVDEQLNFYFLEMNTRLQVEHPVTEMITGLDLVKEQIRIARDEKLSFTQDDLAINGHAVELRVYAEDPLNNFLPDIGNLRVYVRPQGSGVRVDDGYYQGMDIPIYYDPMIAKLAVWGSTRKEALDRMVRACDEYRITGVKNTLAFGRYVMQHPAFVSGDFDTKFIEKHFNKEEVQEYRDEEAAIAAALSVELIEKNYKKAPKTAANEVAKPSKWKNQRRMS